MPLDNIRKLYNLPASTKVHYTDWVFYLIDLAHYLHAIVCLAKDSYALLRSNVLADKVRLTAFDAFMFVQPPRHDAPRLRDSIIVRQKWHPPPQLEPISYRKPAICRHCDNVI